MLTPMLFLICKLKKRWNAGSQKKKLINENLLSNDQIKWINNYHKDVYTKLNPYLEDKHRLWLFNKTKMI